MELPRVPLKAQHSRVQHRSPVCSWATYLFTESSLGNNCVAESVQFPLIKWVEQHKGCRSGCSLMLDMQLQHTLVEGARSTFNLSVEVAPCNVKIPAAHTSKFYFTFILKLLGAESKSQSQRHPPGLYTSVSPPHVRYTNLLFCSAMPFSTWIHLPWFVRGCTGHSGSHRGWRGDLLSTTAR